MPKIYAELHDNFMKEFLETSKTKIIGSERLIFAQDKDGFIVPCTLMIKILPSLVDGI